MQTRRIIGNGSIQLEDGGPSGMHEEGWLGWDGMGNGGTDNFGLSTCSLSIFDGAIVWKERVNILNPCILSCGFI